MAWFTSSRSSNKPSRSSLKPASLTSPPNIYASANSSSPPTEQPPTTRPSNDQTYPYLHHKHHRHPVAIPPPLPPHSAGYHHQDTPPACPPYIQTLTPLQDNFGRWSDSVVHLAQDFMPTNNTTALGNQFASSTAVASATYEDIRSRFDNVLTLIDQESLSGHENKLFQCQEEPTPCQSLNLYHPPVQDAKLQTDRAVSSKGKNPSTDSRGSNKGHYQTVHVATSVVKRNYFSKVELYANSKLPSTLPRLRLHSSLWPLLTLAAQYSHRVYTAPTPSERDTHISSSLLSGTKAMRIKSISMDCASAIVFAIRGTASFYDWAVNLNTTPSPPTNFLDDPGNLCHAGFLSTARKMIKPVAMRLRQLLDEDPSRAGYSLLMTGHSAGGAVAALLYSHMLSETKNAESELTILAGCFRRIHCITFGSPPISLLTLERPRRRGLEKSLFLSFANEGDPVVRADKAYVKSLVELLTDPPPLPPQSESKRKEERRWTRPEWKVPPATLSNAGKMIVLRTADAHAVVTDYKTVKERLCEGVVAVTCKEEQLRGMIWGDPVAHMMNLYAGRIDILAETAKRK